MSLAFQSETDVAMVVTMPVACYNEHAASEDLIGGVGLKLMMAVVVEYHPGGRIVH